MARYPDAPAPQGNSSTPYPFVLERPTARGGPSWAQKVKALTPGDVFSTDLTYAGLSWANVRTLYDFWQSVGGGIGTFSFADFNGFERGVSGGPGVSWPDLFVAKGDGIAQAWTLPTFELQCHVDGGSGLIDNVVIKLTGTAKLNITLHPDTTGSDGYIHKGAGVDSFDYLHLAAVPAGTDKVTIAGTCRRGERLARFTNDKFPFNLRNPSNYQGGVISIMGQVA